MADKPSRALVFYGDGLARSVDPSHTHLHALASIAACGFLALPHAPPSESDDERILRELAVLLDASDSYHNKSGDTAGVDNLNNRIPDRFMGMKAAIVTTNQGLKSFAAKLGITVLEFNDIMQPGSQVDIVASELLKLLGFEDGKTGDTSEFDLLLVHIGASQNSKVGSEKIISDDVELINGLVAGIMHKAQSEHEISSRLHLSLVMSYGNVSKDDNWSLSILVPEDKQNSHLSVLFPLQSYTMRGETPRKDVRHHSPMLIAQWQYGVTRKDSAAMYSFEDFKVRGGNLVIPADRFLHEVAFKLWKAPKYGA